MTKCEQFRIIDAFLLEFKKSSYELGKALAMIGTEGYSFKDYEEILERNTDLHKSLRKMIYKVCDLDKAPNKGQYKRLRAFLTNKEDGIKIACEKIA